MTGLTASSHHISASWIGSRYQPMQFPGFTYRNPLLVKFPEFDLVKLWTSHHDSWYHIFCWFFSASINHWKPTYLWPTVWLYVNHGKSLKIIVNPPMSFPSQKLPFLQFPEVFRRWSAPAASFGSTAAWHCPARWRPSAATASPWAPKGLTTVQLCPACGEKGTRVGEL